MGGIYLWEDGRELPDNFEVLAEYPAVEGITPGMTVHILGTMGNQRGNDHLIRGHDGDDILFGGFGNDRLYGHEGDDTINGDAGTDFIDGGDGTDRCTNAAITDGCEL